MSIGSFSRINPKGSLMLKSTALPPYLSLLFKNMFDFLVKFKKIEQNQQGDLDI